MWKGLIQKLNTKIFRNFFVLGTINGPWKCESNISLQSEALEKAKADASKPTEPVQSQRKNQTISAIKKYLFLGINLRK